MHRSHPSHKPLLNLASLPTLQAALPILREGSSAVGAGAAVAAEAVVDTAAGAGAGAKTFGKSQLLVAVQVALDQGVVAPVMTAVFYASMTLLSGRSPSR